MRCLIAVLLFLCCGVVLWGQGGVTVAEVESALRGDSHGGLRHNAGADRKMAERLAEVRLTEQMSEDRFAALVAETQPGEKTVEQLRMLMDASVLMPPPKDEVADMPAPDEAKQRAMIARAQGYVRDTLRHLPDFVATRETESFNDGRAGWMEEKPKEWKGVPLHWMQRSEGRITYRDGAEVVSPVSEARPGAPAQSFAVGLVTSGEFGPVLNELLGDGFVQSVRWSRWQVVMGKRLAVFRYAVSRADSQYGVDYCCGWWTPDKQSEWEFHDVPGYEGEIYLEPESGVVERLTQKIVEPETAPLASVLIGVWYGPVTIGEKQYICPVRSVAVSQIRNAVVNVRSDEEFTRYVNEVRFLQYRKFGSEGRLVPVE